MKKMLFILLLTMAGCAQASIQELSSVKDLKLNEIDRHTLVVFDIDNTLLRQTSMIGTHQWGDYMSERARRRGLDEKAAKDYQYAAFAELQPSVGVVPVESETIELLSQLEQKHVRHFALTARSAVLKDTTIKQLEVMKHNFSENFPEMKTTDFLKDYLKAGVIFSGSTPKGDLLKQIIDNSAETFTKIIFVDDKLYNLESVEKSFAGSSIQLISYRYGAADPIVQSFDARTADVEYSIFKDVHELISDADAVSLLRAGAVSIAQFSFDATMQKLAPLAEPQGRCEDVGAELPLEPNPDRVAFVRCHYMMDQEWPSNIDYEMKRDPVTGSLYYGKW